jgi:hypothetical protein
MGLSNHFFLSSNFFLEFSISRTSSEPQSAAFTKQSFREKIVFASSTEFPASYITYLYSGISDICYDKPWGAELRCFWEYKD